MSNLSSLPLKQAYHKPEDNIASEFYLPCMAFAKRYDRAVGYFSSTIYSLAWPSIKAFVKEGGKIRLICCPVISGIDVEAMNEGYSARNDDTLGDKLAADFRRLLTGVESMKPAKVLATPDWP